jgi:hypothetical protein
MSATEIDSERPPLGLASAFHSRCCPYKATQGQHSSRSSPKNAIKLLARVVESRPVILWQHVCLWRSAIEQGGRPARLSTFVYLDLVRVQGASVTHQEGDGRSRSPPFFFSKFCRLPFLWHTTQEAGSHGRFMTTIFDPPGSPSKGNRPLPKIIFLRPTFRLFCLLSSSPLPSSLT